MQIKTTKTYHFTPVRMTIINKSKTMWRRGYPSELLVGMQISAATVESSMEIPQKIKNGPFDPVKPLLEIYVKEPRTLIEKNISTRMFVEALFTITKIWKQPKCPSVDKWIKQLGDIYKYSLAVKNKKVLPFEIVCLELENIMLSEINKSEKDKHNTISVIWGI